MKKAVGYIRVSTEGQKGKHGIPAQKRAIETYAKENDIEIELWYTDVISGVKDDRPEFNKILELEDNPPTDCILVAKSDRLARDVNVYFYYKMMLKKKGIELISVSEDLGMLGEFAPLLESFIICVADMERKNITRRTHSGRRVKARNGGFIGGHAPFGYMVVNGELVVNDEEANTVSYIFDMKYSGFRNKEILESLNKRGYRMRNGKEWVNGTLYKVLQKEMLYKGYYRYDDIDWVKGKHEAILID